MSYNVSNDIWKKIFNFLTPNDLQQCSRVCKTWLIKSNDAFNKNYLLRLCPESIAALNVNNLTSIRKFKEIHVKSIDFTVQPHTFISKFKKTLEKITFTNCQFESVDTLTPMLLPLLKLKSVILRDPIMVQLENYEKNPKIEVPLRTLDYLLLDFLDSPYMFYRGINDRSWEMFKAFNMINLQFRAVDLKFCMDQSSFYYNIEVFLMELHQNYGKSLRSIEIKNKQLSKFSKVIDFMCGLPNLQLNSLKMNWFSDDKDDNERLKVFLDKQNRLKTLDIAFQYLENELSTISNCLPKLNELFVSFFRLDQVYCFNEPIKYMKNLKKLHIQANNEGLVELKIPQHLYDFKLNMFNLETDGTCELRLSTDFVQPNITKITLNFVSIRNDVLLDIFENMPNLEHLEVFRTTKQITPIHFCGKKDKQSSGNHSISSLKKLKYLHLDSMFINDSVLAEIQAPRLTTFILWYHMKGMETVITTKGLEALSRNCPLLKTIRNCRGKVIYKRSVLAPEYVLEVCK